PLVAVVYCRATYPKALWSPVPQKPSHAITFQWRRTAARCARMSGHANGIITATATPQRMQERASGETWPTMARPITQLSDQKSDVRLSSRYGEAWNAAVRPGIERRGYHKGFA